MAAVSEPKGDAMAIPRALCAVRRRERASFPAARQIDHAFEQSRQPCIAFQQFQAQRIGVLTALVRHFVKKGFIQKIIHRIADRTPIGQRGRALHKDLRNALGRNGVFLAGQTFQRRIVDLGPALVGDALGRPFGDADGFDGNGHARCIQRAAKRTAAIGRRGSRRNSSSASRSA
jgi:hypothetical protein